MINNKKTILLILLTITTLILLSTASATQDTNTTTTSSIKEKTTTTEPVVKEKIEKNAIKNVENKEKKIDKKDKTKEKTKKDPIIIDGVSYSNIFENQVFDCEENLIQIKINENTFINNCRFTDDDWGNAYLKNYATCNINNTKIESNYNPIIIFNSETTSKMIINNSIICGLTNRGELYVYNSTFNGDIGYSGDLCLYGISKTIIDDLTTLGPNFRVENTPYTKGTIYTNNTQVINKFKELNIPGITIISGDGGDEENNITIENQTISEPSINDKNTTYINCYLNSTITNYANLTLLNSTLNSTIYNRGTLIIDDNCILGEGLILDNDGEIITNDIYRLIPYMTNLKGNYTFENMIITDKIINNGNLTLINCNLSNNIIKTSLIENKGFLSLMNCIIENNTGNGVIINSTGDLVLTTSNIVNNSLSVINVPTADKNGVISVNITNNYFDRNNLQLAYPYAIYLNKSSRGAVANIYGNTFIKSRTVSNFNSTIVENNTFTDSNIQMFNNNVKNASNRVISNIFNNSTVEGSFLVAYNNTFYNGGLSGSDDIVYYQYSTNYFEAYNNTFNNATLSLYCAKGSESIGGIIDPESIINNTIYNNVFVGETNRNDVITLKYPEYNQKTKIYDNTYIKAGILDTVTFNLPPKIYVNDSIGFTYKVTNPEYYDADLEDRIKYDILIDDILYAINTTSNIIQLNSSGEHTITVTTNIGSKIHTRTVDVLPVSDVIITPSNINRYLDNMGTLTRINENDRVLFQGEFTNLGEIVIDTSDVVIDGKDAHFTNTSFKLEASYILIQNMNIDNTNTEPAITNSKKNNHILNNNINQTNTEGVTTAIKNIASNTQIRNNNIYVDGPAKSIDYQTNGVSNTQAILVTGGNKNIIQNNTITVTTTQPSEEYGTIEGITINNGVTDTNITQNTIFVSNAKFSYGINMLQDVEDNSITENNITVTSYRYTCGIQVANNAENNKIYYNNIYCECHNTTPVDEEAISYGIVTSSMSEQAIAKNIDIRYNNITLDSTVGYGIEIYKTNTTEIRHNNILVTGAYSMGIGFAHSVGSNVVANYIYCLGDSTIPLQIVTEDIQPETCGIKIILDSDYIKINDGYVYGRGSDEPNTIHTYDTQGKDYCINIDTETEGVEIDGNNKLRSSNPGDIPAHLIEYHTDPTIPIEYLMYVNRIKNTTPFLVLNGGNELDKIYTHIEINTPETTIINKTIPINITIKDEYDNNLVLGKQELIQQDGRSEWIFNRENVTLTMTINNQTENITIPIDENTITYYYTPTSLGEQNITITFPERTYIVYVENGVSFGSYDYNATTTTKTLTVNPKPVSYTNTTTENLTVGESTTITATFYTDDDQLAGDGKAIFRVNGKTLRYDDGTVIFADVINGRAELSNVNITNEWMKPGTTIQAVYMGDNNNEPIITTPTNVTVTKPEATISLEAPREAIAGQEITLKANVTDGVNAISSGRVAFKLNGKTLKNAEGKALYANVENGIATITYTIPEKTKAKEYVLTAVFTDAKYDRKEANSTLNVVKV